MIGYDILKSRIIRMDFKQRQAELLPRLPEQAAEVVVIEMRTTRPGDCNVGLKIGGLEETPFAIDTGSIGSTGTMTPLIISRLKNAGKCRRVSKSAHSDAAGTMESSDYLIDDSITLGSHQIREPVFDEGGTNVLGMSFWSRFDSVTIDFPNNKLYVVAGDAINRPEVLDRSGLRIWKVDGSVRVAEARTGSPADSAGVQAGDILTHVDQIAVNKLSMLSIRRKLSAPIAGKQPERKVRLTCERDGIVRNVVLPLNVWPKLAKPDMSASKRLPEDTPPLRRK